MRLARSFRWIAFLTSLLALPSAAVAQSAEETFFRGKTLRVIVGYTPGGGYDFIARAVAPYLKKYLNAASVVIENKPGAGGITALNALSQAPPDGLQIMLVKGNAASMAQLTEESGVRYDMTKLGVLGGTGPSVDVWLTGTHTGVTTPSQAIEQRTLLRWGAIAPMDGLADGASLTCEALRLTCKVIMGYPGASDVALALSRGEVDHSFSDESSAFNYVKSGNIRPVAAISRRHSRFFPTLPTIFESLALTPEQEWWFDFRYNANVLGRVLMLPPGMNSARLAYMQAAVRKALTDPDLLAESERSQRFIDYQDPTAIQASVKRVLGDISDEERRRVRLVTAKTQ